MLVSVSNVVADNGKVSVSGWFILSNSKDSMGIKIIDVNGKNLDYDVNYYKYNDSIYHLLNGRTNFLLLLNDDLSFPLQIKFFSQSNPKENLVVEMTQKYGIVPVKKNLIKRITDFLHYFLKSDNKKDYLKLRILISDFNELEYNIWLKRNSAGKRELDKQRKTKFSYSPLISIVVPVYNPKPEHLIEFIESVRSQTYTNWQLCLANGSADNEEINRIIKKYSKSDERIKCGKLRNNRGISGNTNAAVKLADGEWIAFSDQDDFLFPNTLFEYVSAINQNKEIDILYCDEDKYEEERKKHIDPHFKPDFNIYLLRSCNYITHMLMTRKTLLEQVGGFNPEYDGSQDYDMTLRLVERSTHVHHIPKILYSWRIHSLSCASDSGAKPYAYKAGEAALTAHFKRVGIEGVAYSSSKNFGMYKTEFNLSENPLVSVLIPNKDHGDDLERCVLSLLEKASYQNYEIIIIENNSTKEETFKMYEKLKEKDSRIRVETWDKGFNYSAINNYGASLAKGEYLLLLNNDTQIISPELFESMLGYCMRDDVGAVGVKLLYEHNLVQHAGLIVGIDNAPHHVFLGATDDDPGYMGRACVSQNISGVTGACLMVSHDAYMEVGGMDEAFSVAYNDVDFCLKLEKAGYLNVYDAYVKMYHYESKTRGYENSDEANERFKKEKELLIKKWGDRLKSDPYYNRNLSLKHGYYRL